MGTEFDRECKPGSPQVLAERSRDRKVSVVFLFLFAILFFAIQVSIPYGATTSGKTVRHHRVEEGDPDSAKLTEAENDLAKRDYAAAEPILRQIVAQHPQNYVAWYDLGYLCHALGRKEDSIAAYRKSLDAKPDVFESNLNLGLGFAETGQPEAEQYLRAATKLEPRSEPAQGRKRAWMALGTYLQSRNPEQALESFRQAALADPEDAEPHLLTGSLLEKQHPAEAEKE